MKSFSQPFVRILEGQEERKREREREGAKACLDFHPFFVNPAKSERGRRLEYLGGLASWKMFLPATLGLGIHV